MRLVQLPVLLYLSDIGCSENKEMSGHLLLQSSVGGCVVISQNSLITWQYQKKNLGRAGFIFSVPVSVRFCSTWTYNDTQTVCVSYTPGRVKHCSRKESVVTYIRGEWQALPPVDRLSWKEMVKMRERERQVLSGTIQLPSELYWIPPPFKIKRQISLDSPGSERKNHIIFPRQPRSLYPLPAPFQRVLYITLSTVDFYYLSYAFLNT